MYAATRTGVNGSAQQRSKAMNTPATVVAAAGAAAVAGVAEVAGVPVGAAAVALVGAGTGAPAEVGAGVGERWKARQWGRARRPSAAAAAARTCRHTSRRRTRWRQGPS